MRREKVKGVRGNEWRESRRNEGQRSREMREKLEQIRRRKVGERRGNAGR